MQDFSPELILNQPNIIILLGTVTAKRCIFAHVKHGP